MALDSGIPAGMTELIVGAGRGMLPRPKRLKTSGTLRWSLNLATGYIPRRAFGMELIVSSRPIVGIGDRPG